MKILHVNHRDVRHPKAGGLENMVHEISRRWVQQGYKVTIVCAAFKGAAPEETIDGIQINRVGREEYFNFVAGPWLCLKNWFDADVVIEHLSKIACLIPLFLKNRPFMAHVPHLFGKTIFEETSWPVALYVYAMEHLIPTIYGRVPLWALSESTAKDLVDLGIPSQNIQVVSGGVDTSFFDKVRHPTPFPSVLYVGRLRKYKGLVTPLLDTWQLVLRKKSDAKLLIIGKGNYEPVLKREIEQRGLQKSVELLGFVDEKRKAELISSSWLLVYPSLKEGWGLPVIEAGAAGVPTVANDAPGLREAVCHEKTGLLVPNNDVSVFAESILRLIEDDAYRNRLGDAAKLWSKNFEWDLMAERLLTWIHQQFPELKEIKKI